MPSASLPSSPNPVYRVILVGRTGLDAALRHDPRFELHRVANALDALGELADPTAQDTASRSVVIIAKDAEPPGAQPTELLDSLRQLQPGVTILRVSTNGDPAPPAYDASLTEQTDAGALFDMLEPELNDTPQPIFARDTSNPYEAPLPADDVTPAATGDRDLVHLLLRGEDILERAVLLIRARTGDPTIRFIGADEHGDLTTDPAGGTVAEVRWHQRLLGVLQSDRLSEQDLTHHVEWLAAWARLSDQHHDLRDAAFTDSLSGAWNRRYFDRFLAMALAQAKRNRASVTVLVFDIDDFKQYNDNFGHAAGDEILRESVRLLESVIRPTDRVCRIGGDEFAVIFHEPEGPRDAASKHPESVFEIATRFQKQIAAHHFPKLGSDAPGNLTISGGLATYPWDGRTATELLECADGFALESKRTGKNAIKVGPDFDAKVRAR